MEQQTNFEKYIADSFKVNSRNESEIQQNAWLKVADHIQESLGEKSPMHRFFKFSISIVLVLVAAIIIFLPSQYLRGISKSTDPKEAAKVYNQTPAPVPVANPVGNEIDSILNEIENDISGINVSNDYPELDL